MRVLDAILGRGSSARFNPSSPSGAAVLMQSFGAPDNERIAPTFLNAAASYTGSAVVFGVIAKRISLFSEAQFKFQRRSDKSLFGTETLLLLEEPWPNGTTGDLLARMELDVCLAGNSFIRNVRGRDRLERLRPDWVTIVSELFVDEDENEYREVVGYIYAPPTSENRKPAYYPVEDVVHWAPIPDPLAEFRGMSWLTPVLREVDADVEMTDYKRAYLNNAATPNLLVRYSGKIGNEKLARLSDQLHARHGGVGNAFKTLILDEGADTTVLGNNFEQMAFAAVQSAGENRIAVAGQVPAIVVGLKEGLAAATYSNFDQAMRAFADLFGRPEWRSVCAALAKLVEVPADARLWFDIADVAALRQGEKEQADTMQVLATAANTLITAGYDPASIVSALSAGDVTLLKHTGRVSVQLQEPGSVPPAPSKGEPA